MNTTAKHRKRIRLPRIDYADPCRVYFVTVRARDGTRPFQTDDFAREAVNCVLDAKSNKGFSLYCYCLMPDHLHLAISPPEQGPDVVALVQYIKGLTTRKAWEHGFSGALWQRSFYDHIARREESVYEICQYIIDNPVRAGLAGSQEEYPLCGLVDPI